MLNIAYYIFTEFRQTVKPQQLALKSLHSSGLQAFQMMQEPLCCDNN